MAHAYSRSSDRVRVDLIEADVDMTFGLVDDIREQLAAGDLLYARRALEEATKKLTDIKDRLEQLSSDRSAPFGPLVEELRRSISDAQAECA